MLIHQGLESTFSIGRGGIMYWEGEAWDLSAFSDYCKSYYGTNIMPVNIMSVKYCDSHVKVTNRNVTCIKDRKLKRVYSNHRPVQLLYETWDTFSINLFFINFSDFLLENLDCWENQVTFCFCMRFKHMALKFMKGKIFYYVIIMYIGVSLFFTKPPLKSANSPSLWSKSTFWVNP